MFECLYHANNPYSYIDTFKKYKIDYSCFNKMNSNGMPIFKLDSENIENQINVLIKLKMCTFGYKSIEELKKHYSQIKGYLERLKSQEKYDLFLKAIDRDKKAYFNSELFKSDFIHINKLELNNILANLVFPDSIKVSYKIDINYYNNLGEWLNILSLSLYDTITKIEKDISCLHVFTGRHGNLYTNWATEYPPQIIRRIVKQYLDDIA